MIRAITLTVSLDGGPTVQLAYDPRHADQSVPGWQHQYEIVVPCTTVSIEQQPGSVLHPAPAAWAYAGAEEKEVDRGR